MHRRHPVRARAALLASLVLGALGCGETGNEFGVPFSAAAGRFEEHVSCEVTPPPDEVNLDGYYAKYVNCTGIPVVGSAAISDEALRSVSDLIGFMMTGRTDVKDELVRVGAYYVLVPGTESFGLDEAPEFSGLRLEATGNTLRNAPVSVAGVPNALCDPDSAVNGFVGANVAMHELVHLMHLHAFATLYPEFDTEIRAVYQHAVANGLWSNTYLRTNYEEYLAAGVTVWYGELTSYDVGREGDGTLNDVNTRAELEVYDPNIHQFLAKYFNPAQDVPGCLTPSR